MLFYHEIFTSIQGESTDAGVPTTFIRLFGCPYRCIFCDQPQMKSQKRRISLANLIYRVERESPKYVCITGGEPLIQDDVYPLIYELVNLGYKVSVETSGCVPIEKDPYDRSFKYVMDIKCPCSGISEKNVFGNLANLQKHDEVKFVIATRKDYDFFKEVINKYPTPAKILLSPMFDADGSPVIGQKLTEWVLHDKLPDVKIGIQMHKILNVK